MLQINKHKLDYDEGIKNRLDFICKYVNVKPKFIQGNLINIKRTNLNYVEPHRMIVNNSFILSLLCFSCSTRFRSFINSLFFIKYSF